LLSAVVVVVVDIDVISDVVLGKGSIEVVVNIENFSIQNKLLFYTIGTILEVEYKNRRLKNFTLFFF
jgi:hypothetical protein